MVTEYSKEFNISSNVLDHISDGAYIVNANRKILFWNKSAEKITGYKAREVIGLHCWENIVVHIDEKGKSLCKLRCPSLITINEGQIYKSEAFIRHREGHRIPVRIQAIPIVSNIGEINRCINIFSSNVIDSTNNKERKRFDNTSVIDPLTGLVNRQYFEIRLNDMLNELIRYDWPFGIVFIGIDNIMKISKKYGSYARDEIIKMIAKTITCNTRSFDVCTRWGKEGFILMLVNVDEGQLYEISERLRVLVAQSYITFITEKLSTTISIGSLTAQKDLTANTLIKRAEELMYHSKAQGGNRISRSLFS